MPFGKRGEHKSRLFQAMYDGECDECGFDFDAGDKIGYAEDNLLCEECWMQVT